MCMVQSYECCEIAFSIKTTYSYILCNKAPCTRFIAIYVRNVRFNSTHIYQCKTKHAIFYILKIVAV